MTSDPYAVLGLRPGASAAEVKRAYRTLAKLNHPDSAGERALPRFLAIQAAYEQLVTTRPRQGGRTRTASRPSEPWRADPDRAREARETGRRAGADRGSGPGPDRRPGGPRARGGDADAGPGAGSARSTAGASSGTGAPGARRPSSGGGRAAGTGSGSRRRGTRKATFGSTTYDEVHEAVDPTWQGAAWYGQSSGEYWTVNPREYADPRKHGPEYQARAAARAARAAAREDAAANAAWANADDSARAEAAARAAAATRAASAARAEAERLEREADARARAERPRDADSEPPDPGAGLDLRRFEGLLSRRGVSALAAWPPLGIAAAAVIGQATGCAAFSAACTNEATYYPWVAQVAILAVLLLLPTAARILTGGTIAVIVLAFPVTAALSASGAAYDPVHGPPALIVILALAWILGVFLMGIRLRHDRLA
jgi:hypothetical protein